MMQAICFATAEGVSLLGISKMKCPLKVFCPTFRRHLKIDTFPFFKKILLLFFQPFICKLDVLFPIVIGHGMSARTDVISRSITYRCIEFRKFQCLYALISIQIEDFFRMSHRKKFSLRVCPTIFYPTSYVYRTRSNQGNQLMLVHRKLVFVPTVFMEVLAEPIRERQFDLRPL